LDCLLDRDGTGGDWLNVLLGLADHPGRPQRSFDLGPLEEHAWAGNPKERRLDPPFGILNVLVDRLYGSRRHSPIPKRQALFNGDTEARAEALSMLETRGFVPRSWWVFEGRTAIDAYLQTPDALIVVEGKRTEQGPTEHTTWMRGRNQLLRNMDSAFEIRDGREVIGFYLVEGVEPDKTVVPPHWVQAAAHTIEPATLAAALPHRTEAEQLEIARGFLGVATWAAVCAALEIPTSVLLDEAP
jgi:hypothetical protein